jgi:cytochrome c oxidase subunit 2
MRIQFNLFSLLLASTAARADISYNLTEGVTPLSHDIYTLHMLILWVCVAIGVLVFGVMLYAIIYHRQSKGYKAVHVHENDKLEMTWTIIPLLILILMAIPATRVLLNMNDTAKEDITIKITGYQWKWRYEYLNQNLNFFSNSSTPMDQINGKAKKDHPLVVPIHKKIRFLMTSNDVIHSWWVPDLGVKRDALPGYINEAWARINKPGTYYGQCTELCGMNHAYMPIVVIALSEKDFEAWVAAQKGQGQDSTADLKKQWSIDELKQRGEKVYGSICAACHQPTGLGMPPTFPALNGSAIVNGPVAAHINRVMNGKDGTAMQAFKNQLGDVDIAAVITYERNSWNNHTGVLVQPVEVKAARDGKTVEEENAALAAIKTPAGAAAPAVATTPATATTPAASTAPAATASAAPGTPATQALSLDALMQKGEQVFATTCSACHQLTGEGMPPTFPALKGSPIVTGPVEEHINRVMNGKPGTAMQAFKDQLSDDDLAAVITYERNSWGNKQGTGAAVQPSDIAAARAKPPAQ